jgi:hypothetical protein
MYNFQDNSVIPIISITGKVWAHKTSLFHVIFYWSACTKTWKWAVMHLCVSGMDFASFCDFIFWFSKFPTLVFFFHFVTGDSLTYHNNITFATKDQYHGSYDCPMHRHGGWWYNYCSYANLNGKYQPGVSNKMSVSWKSFRGVFFSLKRAQMMMRKN